MDFNVFDVFKNQKDEYGNPIACDPQILLLENLENKTMAKFKIIDNQLKNLVSNSNEFNDRTNKLQDKNLKFEKAIKLIGDGINKNGGSIKLDLGEEDTPNYARMEEVKKYVENRINE